MMLPRWLALPATLFLLAPAAAGPALHGTTAPGDVDLYGPLPGAYQACAAVETSWRATLTLLAPSPGERVLLSVQRLDGWEGAPADAAVASYEQPRVQVFLHLHDGCMPLIAVVGLVVVGFKPYLLEW